MPADDDWVLVSNYADKTLMRNALAYETAAWMGSYAPRTRFVEVRLNGRYAGVYSLIEKLKLHEDRVKVREPGQLMEWTSESQTRRKGVDFRLPVTRVPMLMEDPKRDEVLKKDRRSVRRSLFAADRAMYSTDWTSRAIGWRKHIRARSAVDFVLLNEFFKNHDGFSSSVYLNRGRSGRWNLGPVWDFDHSMGNMNRGSAGVVDGWMLADRPWAERLYADPGFTRAVAARWRELREQGLATRIATDIDRWYGWIESSGAATRNFERWPILGSVQPWDPSEAANRLTYESEVQSLRDWFAARIAWMDAHIDELGGSQSASQTRW
jgi:hypothetical protein